MAIIECSFHTLQFLSYFALTLGKINISSHGHSRKLEPAQLLVTTYRDIGVIANQQRARVITGLTLLLLAIIYTIILLKSIAVRKLQVAILARSSREMSQTVRID